MSKFQVQRTHSNIGLFAVFVLVQLALLLLFAYQTWEFVNVLYPADYLLMRVLSVFSVDGLALCWACLIWFYRFAHPHAKTAARAGKWVDYILSGLISVAYMVMTYTFRFYHITNLNAIQLGTVFTIGALIFNVVMVFVFLDNEIKTRWPAEDEYELVGKSPAEQQSFAQTSEPARQWSGNQPTVSGAPMLSNAAPVTVVGIPTNDAEREQVQRGERTFDVDDVKQMIAESDAQLRQYYEAKIAAMQHPKATAPLGAASQPGQANGHKAE